MFYKITDGNLTYGPIVCSPDYTLMLDTKDEHTYPVDGWYYFETEEEAKTFFNIKE
jgi:hypothetical protein